MQAAYMSIDHLRGTLYDTDSSAESSGGASVSSGTSSGGDGVSDGEIERALEAGHAVVGVSARRAQRIVGRSLPALPLSGDGSGGKVAIESSAPPPAASRGAALEAFLERSRLHTLGLLEQEFASACQGSGGKGSEALAFLHQEDSSDNEEVEEEEEEDSALPSSSSGGSSGSEEGGMMGGGSLRCGGGGGGDCVAGEMEEGGPGAKRVSRRRAQRRPFYSAAEDAADEAARQQRLPPGAIDRGYLSCAACFTLVARHFAPLEGAWLCLDPLPAPTVCAASAAAAEGGEESCCGSGGGGGGGGCEGMEGEAEGLQVAWGVALAEDELAVRHLRPAAAATAALPVLARGAGAGKRAREVERPPAAAAEAQAEGPPLTSHPLCCAACKACIGGIRVGGASRAVLTAVLYSE